MELEKLIKKTFSMASVIILTILFVSCSNGDVKHKVLSKQEKEGLDNNGIKTINSLRIVNEPKLFTMNYYGDYSFKKYLETGSSNDDEQYNFFKKENLFPDKRLIGKGSAYYCTCISTKNNNGEALFGRNFDWYPHPTLLLYTHPKDAYASISMVDTHYLGYNIQELSEDYSLKKSLLTAPYYPIDGMNERGVAVGIMQLNYSKPPKEKNEKTISSLAAVRLILDYAASVDEAIVLVKKYNIHFTKNVPIHFLVSDKDGNSAVIEFLDEDVKIVKSNKKWQISTNFILTGVKKSDISSPRYLRAKKVLFSNKGNLNKEEMMQLLIDVKQYNTMWSLVYDLTKGECDVSTYQNYENIKTFKLGKFKE